MRPKTLSNHKQNQVRSLTQGVIKGLLQFKLTHDLTAHQIEKMRDNWRDIERGLHEDYPIRESGVIAILSSSGVEGLDDDDVLITDEPVAPEEAINLLGSFPLNQASCAYVFTMLEQYGDDIVSVINPSLYRKRLSWHRAVPGGSKFEAGTHKERVCEAFAIPFGIEDYAISDKIVLSLMRMKAERNSFAHEGEMEMRFDEFFRLAIDVISYIYLMIMPEPQILIVHNSEDQSERFSDAEEMWRELVAAEAK
jgi:hypothetical protein